MIRKIWDNADFWAGVMYLFFGSLAVYLSRDYPMGTAMRMGPGYFPHYLGILMMLFGIVIAAKGLMDREVEKIGPWAFRPIIVLSIAVIAYGYLMEILGFIPSLVVLIVLSAVAGREYKWTEIAISTVVLVALAVGIFIYGIGLPYQLFWWY